MYSPATTECTQTHWSRCPVRGKKGPRRKIRATERHYCCLLTRRGMSFYFLCSCEGLKIKQYAHFRLQTAEAFIFCSVWAIFGAGSSYSRTPSLSTSGATENKRG